MCWWWQISEGPGWGNFDRPQGEPTGPTEKRREKKKRKREKKRREKKRRREKRRRYYTMCLVCNILQLKWVNFSCHPCSSVLTQAMYKQEYVLLLSAYFVIIFFSKHIYNIKAVGRQWSIWNLYFVLIALQGKHSHVSLLRLCDISIRPHRKIELRCHQPISPLHCFFWVWPINRYLI